MRDNAEGTRKRFQLLFDRFGLSEALSRHVGGGDHDKIGAVELSLLDEHCPLADGELLVEVGCGNGRLLKNLLRRHIRYIGTDIVPDVIKAISENSRPDWEFRIVDGPTIPVKDQTASAVVMFGVASNMYPEYTALLVKEAGRVLRDGGNLLLTYFDIRHHPKYFRAFMDTYKDRADPLGFLDEHFLSVFAKEAGLSITAILPPFQDHGLATCTMRK